MGRENYYKPGSFYRVCDRSGFVVRAERTRKEWNGLIVRDQSWEIRQPQDFVKGVRDDQTVPEARPKPAVYTFVGPAQSTLSSASVQGDEYITVNTPFPFNAGDRLAVTVDEDMGIIFFCTVTNGGSFNADFNSDFNKANTSTPEKLFITPAFQGYAQAGNAIANLSYGNVSASSYGPSNGG